MAPPTWATQAQLEFLLEEDTKWEFIKAGSTTLKSFYIQTTNAFLEKWPDTPSKSMLGEVNGDATKAQKLVYGFWFGVSLPVDFISFILLVSVADFKLVCPSPPSKEGRSSNPEATPRPWWETLSQEAAFTEVAGIFSRLLPSQRFPTTRGGQETV